MIVDFHTHCFPDPLAPGAIKTLQDAARIKAVRDGTARGLKQYMTACGIQKSVVLPVATKPSQIRGINEWAKASADDKLCFFRRAAPGRQ